MCGSRFFGVGPPVAQLAAAGLEHDNVCLSNMIALLQKCGRIIVSIDYILVIYQVCIQYNKINIEKKIKIMNQKVSFSEGVTEYISMALEIWPALQLSLRNLPQAINPPEQSPIPLRNYKSMSPKQFIQTITKDLYNFIYQHDVKVQHIMDYLDDILAILHTMEQEQKTVKYMANQLVQLVNELPDGDATRLVNFRFLYNSLKDKKINCQVQQSAQIQQGQYSDQSDHDMQDEEQQQIQQEDIPQLTPQQNKVEQKPQKQNNEQEDGWIVVKKKSKR